MNGQVDSFLDQTERGRKALLEGASINLSSKISLIYGGDVKYYISVHHLLSTLLVGIGNS